MGRPPQRRRDSTTRQYYLETIVAAARALTRLIREQQVRGIRDGQAVGTRGVVAFLDMRRRVCFAEHLLDLMLDCARYGVRISGWRLPGYRDVKINPVHPEYSIRRVSAR